jgi:hypothetical protein
MSSSTVTYISLLDFGTRNNEGKRFVVGHKVVRQIDSAGQRRSEREYVLSTESKY